MNNWLTINWINIENSPVYKGEISHFPSWSRAKQEDKKVNLKEENFPNRILKQRNEILKGLKEVSCFMFVSKYM